jgi:prolipoprotein diacylglyceryltransferase
MENDYTLERSIERKPRIAQEKVFPKTKNLLLYNFCIRMYLFETSIFGIHIAPTWYGLMYALGFIFCFLFGKKYGKIVEKDLDTILLYIFLGVILGGRLGYIILYNPSFFIANPLEIFSIWK